MLDSLKLDLAHKLHGTTVCINRHLGMGFQGASPELKQRLAALYAELTHVEAAMQKDFPELYRPDKAYPTPVPFPEIR